MIATKPSLKDEFRNTVMSAFHFLKMEINSVVTSAAKGNSPRAVGSGMENGRRQRVIT
jgi:hypothetical protein